MDRLTNFMEITKETDMTQEWGYSHVYKRLAEYEDTGATTAQCAAALELMRKKDAGLVVELPCRVGDTVYEIFNGRMQSFCVIGFKMGIAMDEYGDCEESERDHDEWHIEYSCGSMSCSTAFSEIGKTVFLTRHQAQSALEQEESLAKSMPKDMQDRFRESYSGEVYIGQEQPK